VITGKGQLYWRRTVFSNLRMTSAAEQQIIPQPRVLGMFIN
jgi:hypothetical protein